MSALVNARPEAEIEYHCGEARFEVCAHAFHSLLDIVVAPFFVIALAPLWRTHAVWAHFKVRRRGFQMDSAPMKTANTGKNQ